jgi:hypothetical protein
LIHAHPIAPPGAADPCVLTMITASIVHPSARESVRQAGERHVRTWPGTEFGGAKIAHWSHETRAARSVGMMT